MRHGMPPVQKALDLGMTVSLSSDVECTMSADFFTQMRGLITLQRMHANEAALGGAEDFPALMNCAQAIRHATIEGAKGLRLDHKTGSLTPGKEADIILLDAEAINVAPLEQRAGRGGDADGPDQCRHGHGRGPDPQVAGPASGP
jgi:5-methylthioadenosine/S-adenosylhomocysteine deaminase